MTMRITVKNEDTARRAVVLVKDFSTNTDGSRTEGVVVVREPLSPGESTDFWIHAGRSITVEEL